MRFGRRPLLIWGAVMMYLRVPRRDHRCHVLGVQHLRPEGACRARVHLHCCVRLHPGTQRVDHRRRDLPAQRPCEGYVACRSPSRATGSGTLAPATQRCTLSTRLPATPTTRVKVFFIWGSACACCVIFFYFRIPEVRSAHQLSSNVIADDNHRQRACRSSRLTSCTRTRTHHLDALLPRGHRGQCARVGRPGHYARQELVRRRKGRKGQGLTSSSPPLLTILSTDHALCMTNLCDTSVGCCSLLFS